MDVPDVQYLRTGRGAVAYQCFGDGDRTIVWSGPPLVSIETRWDRPSNVRLWEFLSSLGRVVLFDYRGFGVSEHVPLDRVGDMEELSYDLAAIVTEVATPPVSLLATGGATCVAVDFAATHAGALQRLVLLNASATGPITGTEVEQAVADARARWGTGDLMLRGSATSGSDDASRRIAARVERLSASPAVAEQFLRAQAHHDVRHLLGDVATPTLVIHTGDASRITPSMTEDVATRIPGATYLVRPSTLFNWGEWDTDIKRFITGQDDQATGWRDLAAVVFTDVVGSTEQAARVGDAAWRETLGALDAFVDREVAAAQGRVVKQTGDGHLIEFARPGDALTCACRLADHAPHAGMTLRIGVHFGEVERRPNGDIGGIAVHLAARVAAAADPDAILVSRTVAELTIGDGRTYTSKGRHVLKGVPGEWELLTLDRG